MRRHALAVFAVLGVLAVPATAAHADPSPAPTLPVPSPTPGQPVCTVDPTLYGLTGLVATADGYAVVNQANSGKLQLTLLNNSCQRGSTIQYTGNRAGGARDPRDLAMSADGSAFWVADTGDSVTSPERPTIAVWKLPANRATGTIYHYVYPQGDVHSADAMLLNGDGTPIFVTRALSGAAGIYVPDGQPDPSGKNVPLKKAGEFTPQKTGTDNKLGIIGQQTVTGGANAPDGKHVVLRTLSDAYEWSVPDGNVVNALTTGIPLITPLPGEPQGEAIAYSHDGRNFLTVSNQGSGVAVSILRYTPTGAAASSPGPVGGAGAVGSPRADTRGWFSRLSLQQLTYLVGGVGLLGLLMVIGGVLGIRSGRRPRSVPTNRTPPRERQSGDDEQGGPAGLTSASDGRYDAQRDGRYEVQRDGRYEVRRDEERWVPQRGGNTYRSDGAGPDSGHYVGSDWGAPYQRDEHGGTYRSAMYQGGGPDQYQQPPPPISSDVRRDNGIARSHRTRAPRARGVAPARGGYAEEHVGFDDLRRLTEEE